MTVTKLFVFTAIMAVALTGCGSKFVFGLSETSASFSQNKGSFSNKIDILWVIDNSQSMASVQANLVANFNSFISTFQGKHYDYQMAVTTTDAYLADPSLSGYLVANASKARFRDGTDATAHTGVFVILPNTPNLDSVFLTNLTQGAGSSSDERAFSSFRTALNSPSNSGFVRPNSFLAVIILSDEDDFSGNSRCEGCGNDHDYFANTLDSVDTYVTYLDGLTRSTGSARRYSVSSITTLDSNCAAQRNINIPQSQRYIDLANATGGVLGNICDASYASALDQIQSRIIELSTQFFLNDAPQEDTLSIVVNGVTVANSAINGWTYNASANSIIFHGGSIPAQDAIITVKYKPVKVRS